MVLVISFIYFALSVNKINKQIEIESKKLIKKLKKIDDYNNKNNNSRIIIIFKTEILKYNINKLINNDYIKI